MSRQKKVEPFLLVISDHDNKVFNIIGPITNDNEWNIKVCNLQKQGRDIRCFSMRNKSKEALRKEYSQQMGYKFTDNQIVDKPQDISNIYNGSLPDYAMQADRKKVVKIFCDKCKSTRWAEMEKEYPGEKTLKNAQILDYAAKCLKCGFIAQDPYNWFRS